MPSLIATSDIHTSELDKLGSIEVTSPPEELTHRRETNPQTAGISNASETMGGPSKVTFNTLPNEAISQDQGDPKVDVPKQSSNHSTQVADSSILSESRPREIHQHNALETSIKVATPLTNSAPSSQIANVSTHSQTDPNTRSSSATTTPTVQTTGGSPLVELQTPSFVRVQSRGTEIPKLDEQVATDGVWKTSDGELPELFATQGSDAKSNLNQSRISPDAPRLISAQVVEIARTQPDKPVELTLNPEELGRLRMTFQSDSTSMNVVLQVERPETLELMRRHIELLAQDMKELGYEDVSFSFQQQNNTASSEQQQENADEPDTTSLLFTTDFRPTEGAKVTTTGMVGMDIRI